jgi:hypothetical protein
MSEYCCTSAINAAVAAIKQWHLLLSVRLWSESRWVRTMHASGSLALQHKPQNKATVLVVSWLAWFKETPFYRNVFMYTWLATDGCCMLFHEGRAAKRHDAACSTAVVVTVANCTLKQTLWNGRLQR